MGSVIVIVECDGVVVKVWLVPNLQLYILASSGDELAALHSRRSESESESCHCSYLLLFGEPVDWFISAVLSSTRSHSDLARLKGSKMEWRRGLLQCDPGLQGRE